MTPATSTRSTTTATSARPKPKRSERGQFSELQAKALRLRRYAVSINAHPRLIALGDYQFDKALFFRAKAPKNGRCSGYFAALAELNRALETYSFAGAPRPMTLPNLAPLLRKKVRKVVENRLTVAK
ncbi:hypothetical protein [Pseudomonas monteilii]|uniref:hypothetical protein n=1 Tax=Pseudomonas monteilii TaxID=76759 RepID=UPI001FCF7FA1|nr:hypothetical protein [Pseudomonas monteilii]MCJ7854612.1 hypothetical protein [Pseudomonas monteilii]